MAEMDFDREVGRVADQAGRSAEQAQERFARAGSVSATAAAPDGAVSVTVNPGGRLSRVSISQAALRGGADAVAEQVMQLAATATRRSGDKMYRALAPVLGPAGEDHLFSLGYEPLPDDELDEDDVSRDRGLR